MSSRSQRFTPAVPVEQAQRLHVSSMPAVVSLQDDTGASRRQARDKSYFDSYSSLGIHREMLADKVWPGDTEAAASPPQRGCSLGPCVPAEQLAGAACSAC